MDFLPGTGSDPTFHQAVESQPNESRIPEPPTYSYFRFPALSVLPLQSQTNILHLLRILCATIDPSFDSLCDTHFHSNARRRPAYGEARPCTSGFNFDLRFHILADALDYVSDLV
jgi:hypothetical protein